MLFSEWGESVCGCLEKKCSFFRVLQLFCAATLSASSWKSLNFSERRWCCHCRPFSGNQSSLYVSLYKARNICLSVCKYVCMYVCPSHISRTVYPIYFIFGRCIAGDTRECSVKIWCNLDKQTTSHSVLHQQVGLLGSAIACHGQSCTTHPWEKVGDDISLRLITLTLGFVAGFWLIWKKERKRERGRTN